MQSSELMLLPSYNFLQSDFQDPHQHPSYNGSAIQSMHKNEYPSLFLL